MVKFKDVTYEKIKEKERVAQIRGLLKHIFGGVAVFGSEETLSLEVFDGGEKVLYLNHSLGSLTGYSKCNEDQIKKFAEEYEKKGFGKINRAEFDYSRKLS